MRDDSFIPDCLVLRKGDCKEEGKAMMKRQWEGEGVKKRVGGRVSEGESERERE